MEYGSRVDTHQLRVSLIQASKGSKAFIGDTRGCVLEAFEVILQHLHESTELCPGSCLMHSVFTLTSSYSATCCQVVNSETEDRYTLTLPGMLLLSNYKTLGLSTDLNIVINSMISAQLLKYFKCSCGSLLTARPSLQLPSLFTVSVLWDSSQMKDSELLFEGMNKKIDLREIFNAVECDGSPEYDLQSMVCYSRFLKHYISVVKQQNGKWTVLSDERKFSTGWGVVNFSLKVLGLAPVLLFYGKG